MEWCSYNLRIFYGVIDMLSIQFGEMDNVLHNVETYFNNQFRYEWLEDEFVKELIKDVDKSVVESPECIMSPVLRQIPPTRLSGGTKAVILMKYVPERIVNASNCGDNCAGWILRLGNEMDLTVNLNHIMTFEGEYEVKILNDGRLVHNMAEMVEAATDYL